MIRARRARTAADDGSDAIARVLRAEREAELALEQARQQGAKITEEARRRALEIAERADARVTRLNVLCREKTREQIEALQRDEREEEALSQRPIAGTTLDDAVQAVADWLLDGGVP